MDYPLSNLDLNKYIKEFEQKGVNIFESKNIKPNTNIEDVFKGRGHCVLYVDADTNDGENIGHWVSQLRDRENNIYFIDSFAEDPNHYNSDILKCYKNNGIKNVYINNKKLQNDESMTCGRYAIIFTALHKMNIDPSKMIDFLNDGKKKYGSVDNFIFKLFGE